MINQLLILKEKSAHFRLSVDLWQKLVRAAKKNGLRISDIIRMAIIDWLKRENGK
jgi:hypothetical protein